MKRCCCCLVDVRDVRDIFVNDHYITYSCIVGILGFWIWLSSTQVPEKMVAGGLAKLANTSGLQSDEQGP